MNEPEDEVEAWNEGMDALGARRGTFAELHSLITPAGEIVVATLDEHQGRADVWFYCPGCKMKHGVNVKRPAGEKGPTWDWNSDLVRPTFIPSLLVWYDWGSPTQHKRCHSFIRNGRMEFLTDCTHELAGQTVPIPPAATREGTGE